MELLILKRPILFLFLTILCVYLYFQGAPLLSLIIIAIFGVFAISEIVELLKVRQIHGE